MSNLPDKSTEEGILEMPTKCDAILALLTARNHRTSWTWCARAVEDLHKNGKSYSEIINTLKEGKKVGIISASKVIWESLIHLTN